jgi:hypothetical protein
MRERQKMHRAAVTLRDVKNRPASAYSHIESAVKVYNTQGVGMTAPPNGRRSYGSAGVARARDPDLSWPSEDFGVF